MAVSACVPAHRSMDSGNCCLPSPSPSLTMSKLRHGAPARATRLTLASHVASLFHRLLRNFGANLQNFRGHQENNCRLKGRWRHTTASTRLFGTRGTCGTRCGPSPALPRAAGARCRVRTPSSRPPCPPPSPLPRRLRCRPRPAPPCRRLPRRTCPRRAQTSLPLAYFRLCRAGPRGVSGERCQPSPDPRSSFSACFLSPPPPPPPAPPLPVLLSSRPPFYGNSAGSSGARPPPLPGKIRLANICKFARSATPRRKCRCRKQLSGRAGSPRGSLGRHHSRYWDGVKV